MIIFIESIISNSLWIFLSCWLWEDWSKDAICGIRIEEILVEMLSKDAAKGDSIIFISLSVSEILDEEKIHRRHKSAWWFPSEYFKGCLSKTVTRLVETFVNKS